MSLTLCFFCFEEVSLKNEILILSRLLVSSRINLNENMILKRNNCSHLSWEGHPLHTLFRCLCVTAAEWVFGTWCRRPESTAFKPHQYGVPIRNMDRNIHLKIRGYNGYFGTLLMVYMLWYVSLFWIINEFLLMFRNFNNKSICSSYELDSNATH